MQNIGSKWVITEKEKHYGQTTLYKAKLVAREFQEKINDISEGI